MRTLVRVAATATWSATPVVATALAATVAAALLLVSTGASLAISS